MKFLCDNCKAKYQIPDEKVAGRTLRMTCRKCGNDILIRGAGVTPSVMPPADSSADAPAPVAVPAAAPVPAAAKPVPARAAAPAPAPAKAAAAATATAPTAPAAAPKKAVAGVPPKAAPAPAAAASTRVPPKAAAPAAAPDALGAATGRPSASALGADFRKKLGSEGQDAGSLRASMPAAPPAAAEEWHVAINDVPVGPIKRDEIARKIGTGQVTGDSLAWREGFDDWRPLRDIPQLASLLEQRRRPSVPPAPRAATTTSRPSGPRTRTSGSGAGPLPASDRSSSNLVPLGGRAAAPVAPPANVMPDSEDADDFALDFASHSSAPPPAAAPAPTRTARTAPVAVLASAEPAAAPVAPPPRVSEPPRERESSQKTPVWVWGMLVAGIFFGVVLGMKGSEWFGSREEVVAAAPPTATPDPVVPQPLEVPEAPVVVDAGVEAPVPEETDTPRHGTTGARPATTATAMTPTAAADDPRFAAFESPTGMTVTPGDLSTGMSAAAAPPLEAAAVQRVVSNNRRALQTCYERAARGQANPPRARMDVSVTVGRSGTVTAVSATGSDFGGLGACLEQSVRRWRFPASSDGGNTRFPVVFSAGG